MPENQIINPKKERRPMSVQKDVCKRLTYCGCAAWWFMFQYETSSIGGSDVKA